MWDDILEFALDIILDIIMEVPIFGKKKKAKKSKKKQKNEHLEVDYVQQSVDKHELR